MAGAYPGGKSLFVHATDLLRERDERIAKLESEVARLEGLILDWWDSYDHYAPSAALEAEAKRIRAAKGESATSSKSKDNL